MEFVAFLAMTGGASRVLMTIDEQKQQFSFAYIRAVAAAACIVVTQPSVDDDSVDLIFHQKGTGTVFRSPILEAQVKCTEAAAIQPGHIAYPLKLKNYNELRPTNLMAPRILIVVLVPDLLPDWLNHSEQELAMRRCGYWHSLRGMPTVPNNTSLTVHLPRINQFTVVQFQAMMARIGHGGQP
jgi:Domain of unknown function (DUF4365)